MEITAELGVAECVATVIGEAEKSLKREQDTLREVGPDVEAAVEIAREYCAAHPEDSVDVKVSCLFDKAEVLVSAHDMRSAAIALLRAARKVRYRRSHETLNSWALEYWHSRKGDPDTRFRLKIQIYPHCSENAVCKRVQIGTKTVAQYALVCDDGPLTPDVLKALEEEVTV